MIKQNVFYFESLKLSKKISEFLSGHLSFKDEEDYSKFIKSFVVEKECNMDFEKDGFFKVKVGVNPLNKKACYKWNFELKKSFKEAYLEADLFFKENTLCCR